MLEVPDPEQLRESYSVVEDSHWNLVESFLDGGSDVL